MKSFSIGIKEKISINAAEYGSRGSAVLGIRDSGKTYTATLLAEKLFDAGIPFVAFDPIGVWRFLRVPGKGRGYPAVVAGGQEGDLPLTVNGAPEIVRAAMRSGVSLIIDLFDINLSKADWKRIVTSCVRVLLHENSKHGLRHIFIEEAAEFAPQRVGPDQGHVYAEIEKLARMGGNSRLGYTLINQRAEEVNKAVLELCDNLFLHRQKGRNSLTALSKWLDIGNVSDHKKIIGSLSTLPTGECWAWMVGEEKPVLVSVQEKNSLHPDRRIMHGAKGSKAKSAIDVGAFVKDMKQNLVEVEAEIKANDPAALRRRIAELEKAVKEKKTGIDPAALQKSFDDGYGQGLVEANDDIKKNLMKAIKSIGLEDILFERLFNSILPVKCAGIGRRFKVGDIGRPPKVVSLVKTKISTEAGAHPPEYNCAFELNGPQRRIVNSLRFWKDVGHDQPSREQVAAVAGYSAGGGAFGVPASQLSAMGIVAKPKNGSMSLAQEVGGNPIDPKANIMSILDGPQKRLLDAFLNHNPKEALTREEVAQRAGYDVKGGAFGVPASKLCTLCILEKPSNGMLKMSDWAIEVLA